MPNVQQYWKLIIQEIKKITGYDIPYSEVDQLLARYDDAYTEEKTYTDIISCGKSPFGNPLEELRRFEKCAVTTSTRFMAPANTYREDIQTIMNPSATILKKFSKKRRCSIATKVLDILLIQVTIFWILLCLLAMLVSGLSAVDISLIVTKTKKKKNSAH